MSPSDPNDRIEISLEDLDGPTAPPAPPPAPPRPVADPGVPTPAGGTAQLPGLPAQPMPKAVEVGAPDAVLPPGALAPGVHYHQHSYVPQTTNGLAIASLALSVLWLYWLGSILAVIFGHVARAQIRNSRGAQGGDGIAIAGLIIGYIGVAVLVFFLVVAGSIASSA